MKASPLRWFVVLAAGALALGGSDARGAILDEQNSLEIEADAIAQSNETVSANDGKSSEAKVFNDSFSAVISSSDGLLHTETDATIDEKLIYDAPADTMSLDVAVAASSSVEVHHSTSNQGLAVGAVTQSQSVRFTLTNRSYPYFVNITNQLGSFDQGAPNRSEATFRARLVETGPNQREIFCAGTDCASGTGKEPTFGKIGILEPGTYVVSYGCETSLELFSEGTLAASGSFDFKFALDCTIKATSNQGQSILGTPNDDLICGGAGDDVIHGLGGNDVILGLEGNDTIFGDDGDDTIDGGPGDDSIAGGEGKDVISGGSGNDRICGDVNVPDPNDFLNAAASEFDCNGAAADDDDDITGGPGIDFIGGGSGADIISGGPDNALGDSDGIQGGFGDDFITSSNGPNGSGDIIAGGPGNDTIVGGGGADAICGATWGFDYDDTPISDALGANCLLRQASLSDDDTIFGGDAPANPFGGRSDQFLRGGPGNDTITGGNARDMIIGDDGDDLLIGGGGNDEIHGGRGSDKLKGGRGDDRLFGGPGHDVLDGGPGRDKLRGQGGPDELRACDGERDIIDGGTGNDVAFMEFVKDKIAAAPSAFPETRIHCPGD